MPVTGVRGRQILDGDVLRNDLNTTTSGSAVITKIIAGTNITITSSGVDAGTGDVTINASGGTGTVTSVGLTAPNIFGVTGSPVTGAGTIAVSLVNQLANTIWAGPTNGAEASPTFRTLVAADIPALTLENLPDAWTKRAVRVATTGNITLSGTQTIDGIAVAVGDRVLVKNQTTTANNGIYVVAAGTWSRSADANTSSEIAGGMVAVDLGTTNGGTTWDTDFRSSDTLGTTAMTWFRMVDTGYGQALTKTDDTNVTLTLGGTPTTALIQATSLTLGWTGQLAVGRGGSGASTLTGVLIGNGTSAFTGVTGTANQLLRRNAGNTAYEFFTPTYLTANQTITLSGNVTGSGTTAITTTIANNVVTNAMLSQVTTSTFHGRVSAGTGNIENLTTAQATSLLDLFSSTLKGLVPASGGGTTNFLRADGTWAAPSVGGGVGGSGTTNTIPKFTAATTLGNSTITDTGTTITLLGTTTFVQSASLPATIGGTLVFVDDYASPIAGRLIFGDGTGWSMPFSRRNTSVTTDLFTFKDSGQLQLNLYTSTSSFTGTSVGVLGFDSSGNILTIAGGSGITGSGTTNRIPVFTGTSAVGNSILTQNSTTGINLTSSGEAQLYIQGGGNGYTQGNIMLQTETSGASARGLGMFLFNGTNQTMWFAGNGYGTGEADNFYIGRKSSTLAITDAADPTVTSMFFKISNAGHLHLASGLAGGQYIQFNRIGTTVYGYVGNSSLLFGAGYNETNSIGIRSEGAINFGTASGVAIAKLQSTGQLKLPLYTSTSSFAGTPVGFLAFDSSGNIITAAGGGGSQWTTSGVNIYYTAGGVSIGTTTTSDILHIGRASGNDTFIRFDQLTRTTWRLGQSATTDPFRLINASAGATRLEMLASGQLILNSYTAFNSFSNTDAQGILGFDTSGNIVSMYAPIYRHSFVSAAPVTASNVPSNISFFASSNSYVTKMDLTGKKRARVLARVTTAATGGTVIRVRYATTFSTTASSYLTMGTSELEIAISSTGFFDTGWINLVAGAKADVFIALLTQGGDGATDPVLNQVTLETEE